MSGHLSLVEKNETHLIYETEKPIEEDKVFVTNQPLFFVRLEVTIPKEDLRKTCIEDICPYSNGPAEGVNYCFKCGKNLKHLMRDPEEILMKKISEIRVGESSFSGDRLHCDKFLKLSRDFPKQIFSFTCSGGQFFANFRVYLQNGQYCFIKPELVYPEFVKFSKY